MWINKEYAFNSTRGFLKFYDDKPIIIIYDADQEQDLVKIVETNKYKYKKGIEAATLVEIRSWDYCTLLLKQIEGRGVDTKF